MPAQQKSSFLAISFEQNIIGEIYESKTFEMSFDICWYLAFASQIDDVDVRARTDIQTHKTTTVTLAAHACRGLIRSFSWFSSLATTLYVIHSVMSQQVCS